MAYGDLAVGLISFALLLTICMGIFRSRLFSAPAMPEFPPPVSLYGCACLFALLMSALLLAVLMVEFTPIGSRYAPLYVPSEIQAWRVPIISILTFVLFVAFFAAFDRILLRQLLSLKLKPFLIGCSCWLLYFPLLLALNSILDPMMSLFDIPPMQQQAVKHLKDSSLYDIPFVLNCFALVVIAPIQEELFFRGVLQNAFNRFFSPFLSVSFAAFIFALFHCSPQYGWRNLELMAYLFLLACFLGFIYRKQQNLAAPIGLHAFANLISITLSFNMKELSA
jgi:membrane protease YdiL (CAAX protease family)